MCEVKIRMINKNTHCQRSEFPIKHQHDSVFHIKAQRHNLKGDSTSLKLETILEEYRHDFVDPDKRRRRRICVHVDQIKKK